MRIEAFCITNIKLYLYYTIMNGDSEDLCIEDSIETVDVIHVQTEVDTDCNVQYIKLEDSNILEYKTEVIEYKGDLFALTDTARWIPVTEVNVSAESEDDERQVGTNEVDNNVNVSSEGETVEIQNTTQVLLLGDGRIAYLQASNSEVDPNAGKGADEPVKEDTNLKLEVKQEKKKGKTHACKVAGCNRSYSTLHHLKVHSRNHTGDRPFKCSAEGCTKAFSTDYSRKAHLRTHTGEKPYSCTSPSCSKKFKTSGDLQKHIRIHTGERPFVCPFRGCNRAFTTSNIRKVHIRTHTGEKPYACTHEGCNKSFASSTNFKNHMRIHSGIKPFCCPVPSCLKKFTEYSSLYKHQLVHSQLKKHQCNFCQKTYRQPSTLTTHKRTTHGVISADDGTEIVIEDMIGLGARSKNFKDITSKLLKLKKDCSAIVRIEEEGTPLYLVSTDLDSVNGLEDGDILM